MIDLERYSREYWGLLRRHAYRLTGSLLDAEDVVQETMLRAIEMGPALENVEDHPEWLHIAATEAALPFMRGHRPLSLDVLELPDLVQTPGPGEAEPPEGGEESGWPGVSMDFLFPLLYMTPEQRAVLVLRDALEDGDRIAAAALGVTLPEVFRLAGEAEARRAEVRRRWGRHVPFAPLRDDEASARTFARFIEALQMRDRALLQGLLLKDAEMVLRDERESGQDFVAAVLADFVASLGERLDFAPVWLNGCRGALVRCWRGRRSEWLRCAAALVLCEGRQVRTLKWELDGHILRSIRSPEPG